MKRAVQISIVALCTGCGGLLGFHDGALAQGKEGDPCGTSATDPSCDNGRACDNGTCKPLSSNCVDGGSDCREGGADPTTGTVASFKGDPGGVLASSGFVYFAHDDTISGCAAQDPCPRPQTMYFNPVNPHPRVLAHYGSLVAWADPVAGKVSYCFFGALARCGTATTFDQPGVRAMTTDYSSGNLYLVNGGTGPTGKDSELRVLSQRPAVSITTVTTLPAASALTAMVSDGPQRKFVQIGRVGFSVVTPTGLDAGPSVVHTLVDEDPALAAPATASILIVGRRVLWTRAADRGGGISQCAILEGAVVCDPLSVRSFAGANDEITAATSNADSVVWARHTSNDDELYFCKPSASDMSEGACVPVRLAKGLRGRVSAITIEPAPLGPDNPAKKVYFVVSEPSTGNVFVERAQIP